MAKERVVCTKTVVCDTQHTMQFIRTLIDHEKWDGPPELPPSLRELYDGDLNFPSRSAQRPYVVANFASTLDGVVSYKIEGQSTGAAISGSDIADSFIMGLLRASADAVLVGANTIRDTEAEALWIPEYTYPDAKEWFADYRLNRVGRPRYPLVVVVTSSGKLDLNRAVFRTPEVRTIVITTAAGQSALAKAGAGKLSSIEVCALEAPSSRIGALAITEFLHSQFGVQILLHEGGAALFGEFLAVGAVDELFLTLSPQIAGRIAQGIRPGLAEGVEFLPGNAPWFQLASVKHGAAYLYLRYRRNESSSSASSTP